MVLKPDYIRRPFNQRELYGDFFGKVEEIINKLDYKVHVFYGLDVIKNKSWFLDKKVYKEVSLRVEVFDYYNKKQVIKMLFEDPVGV